MIRSRDVVWETAGQTTKLGLDEAGDGPTVLLLPALSSISTRREMRGLMAELASYFHVISVDWPGFGDRPRPKLDWNPDLLSNYLEFVLREIAPKPFAIVAAGHACTYALDYLAGHPGGAQHLVSIEPTWRGPFPTMTGQYKPWFGTLRSAIDAPVLGDLLYALNLSRPVMDRMVRQHVYSDAGWLQGEDLAAKLAVTKAPGARHGSVRFVTGALDRVGSRKDFLDLARDAAIPHLLVYGEETPRKSKAEMEALTVLPGVEAVLFRKGKLSLHEEFAWKVGFAVLTFLLPYRSKPSAGGGVEASTKNVS